MIVLSTRGSFVGVKCYFTSLKSVATWVASSVLTRESCNEVIKDSEWTEFYDGVSTIHHPI